MSQFIRLDAVLASKDSPTFLSLHSIKNASSLTLLIMHATCTKHPFLSRK